MSTEREEIIRLWILWLIVALGIQHGESRRFNINVPSTYTVFSDTIKISYSYPRNTNIRLLYMEMLQITAHANVTTLKKEIRIIINRGSQGHVTLLCGSLDHPGKFVFYLLRSQNGPLLAQSNTLTAKWPEIKLTLPRHHMASTQPVDIQFTYSKVICNSRQDNSKYWLDITYKRFNSTETPNSIKTFNIKSSDIDHQSAFRIPCDFLDEAGLYRAVFKSNYKNETIIASSGQMSVQWSNIYRLNVRVPSIFPCNKPINVIYRKPPCAGPDDKIRLFAHVRLEKVSGGTPTNAEYIKEKSVKPGTSSVNFECEWFYQKNPQYCFQYYSMAKSKAVTKQTEVCVQTNRNGIVRNGIWAKWSDWGDCSVTLCGNKGHHTRYRHCTNPAPAGGGKWCQGENVEWKDCLKNCTTTMSTPTTTRSNGSLIDGQVLTVPLCGCGCHLSQYKGKIVATYPCPTDCTQWIITVPKGHSVTLTFEMFDLQENQWVKVRDGSTQDSELLLYKTGHNDKLQVQSKGHVLLLEYKTIGNINQLPNKGFIATYKSQVFREPVAAENQEEERNLWQAPITVIGISICAVIIFIAIVLVLRHRMRKIKRYSKYKLANSISNGQVTSGGDILSVHNTGTSTANANIQSPKGSKKDFKVKAGSSSGISEFHQPLIPSNSHQIIPTESVNLNRSKASSNNSLENEGIHMTKLPLNTKDKNKRPHSTPHERVCVHSSKYRSQSAMRSPYNSKSSDYVHDADLFNVSVSSAHLKNSDGDHKGRHQYRDEHGDLKHHHRRKHRHTCSSEPEESPLIENECDNRQRQRRHHSKSPYKDSERHRHRHRPHSPNKEARQQSPTKELYRHHNASHVPENEYKAKRHKQRSPTKELYNEQSHKHKDYKDVYKQANTPTRTSPCIDKMKSKETYAVPKCYKSYDQPYEYLKTKRDISMSPINENMPVYERMGVNSLERKHRVPRHSMTSHEAEAEDSPHTTRSAPTSPDKQHSIQETDPVVPDRPLSPRQDGSGVSGEGETSPKEMTDNQHTKLSKHPSSSSKDSKHTSSDKQTNKTRHKKPIPSSSTPKHKEPSPVSENQQTFATKHPNGTILSREPSDIRADPSNLTLPVRSINAKPDGHSPQQEVIVEKIQSSKPTVNGGTVGRSPERAKPSPSRSCKTPSDFVSSDGFEYDDYIPNVPGSYFDMADTYNTNWAKMPKTSTPEKRKYFEEKI